MTATIKVGTLLAQLDYYAEGGPQWTCSQNRALESALRALYMFALWDGLLLDGPQEPNPEASLAKYAVSKLPNAELVSVDPPPGWPFVEGRIY